MKNSTLIVLAIMLVCVLSIFAQNSKRGIVPKNGFVPDDKTAVRIAEAVLIPLLGEKLLERERPLKARLSTNMWIVTGTLKQPTNSNHSVMGGVAVIHIDKSSGCITYFTHTR